eukprot:11775843-Ditylum_brightwellii.AAC.1
MAGAWSGTKFAICRYGVGVLLTMERWRKAIESVSWIANELHKAESNGKGMERKPLESRQGYL